MILRTKYLTRPSVITITYFLICKIHKRAIHLLLPAAGENFGVLNSANAIKPSNFMQPESITGKKQAVLKILL